MHILLENKQKKEHKDKLSFISCWHASDMN
jgi:hypothetical protein